VFVGWLHLGSAAFTSSGCFAQQLRLVACSLQGAVCACHYASTWLVRLALYIKVWVGFEPAESIAALFMPHVGCACTLNNKKTKKICAYPALAVVAGL
jgi:hypothetical protein